MVERAEQTAGTERLRWTGKLYVSNRALELPSSSPYYFKAAPHVAKLRANEASPKFARASSQPYTETPRKMRPLLGLLPSRGPGGLARLYEASSQNAADPPPNHTPDRRAPAPHDDDRRPLCVRMRTPRPAAPALGTRGLRGLRGQNRRRPRRETDVKGAVRSTREAGADSLGVARNTSLVGIEPAALARRKAAGEGGFEGSAAPRFAAAVEAAAAASTQGVAETQRIAPRPQKYETGLTCWHGVVTGCQKRPKHISQVSSESSCFSSPSSSGS